MMKKLTTILVAVFSLSMIGRASEIKPLYQNNFEKAAAGSVPEEFLVLDGAFEVKEEGGNKFLELPGAPLETFGVLFGPTEKEGIGVSARIHGTGKGRRFPAFGVGVNGVGGYRLMVSPGKKALELYKGEETAATVPFDWESGKWTHLRLQIRKVKDGQWMVEGKAWAEGAGEPADWTVRFEEKQEVFPGRPTIWGSPFSGTAIRFDDLMVSPAVSSK